MSKKGNSSLNEIMGKKGDKAHENGLDFEDLPQLLGERMPKLEFHTLGRVRLIQALNDRFGPNFRNVPGIHGLLKKFDKEQAITLAHHQIKKRLGR